MRSVRGTCTQCGSRVYSDEQWQYADTGIAHQNCPDETRQTSDERYNALCATLDRIMTGNPEIRVRGGAVSSVAETWRDEKGLAGGRERAVVRFDHDAIKKWATDPWDRTALTLALNIHELGHLWHSPAYGSGARQRTPDVMFFMNVLDDQRQEMLSTLAYPKALDYLRFLNVRGLQKRFEEIKKDRPSERDAKLGREYMLHYGRRHLYPPSVNKELRTAAYHKYGIVAKRIEEIIDEFMALNLDDSLDMTRAWALATELSDIDATHDPETRGNVHSTLGIGDPRHDCAPMDGAPSLGKELREELTKKLRELMKSAPKTKEPSKAQKQRAQKPKQRGENPEQPEPKSEKVKGADEKQEKEKGDEKDAQSEAQDGKDATQDEQSADSQSGKGDGDSEQEEEAGEEIQDGDGEGAGEDQLDDETDTSSRGAGVNENPTLKDPEPKEEDLSLGPEDPEITLDALQEDALDQIEDEVDDRHRAFRKSEMRPEMGGKRKGPLNAAHLATAKRLGLMFKNINQDLVPQTERAMRHGRVDARRLPLTVTANSQRIFKRRVKDLSRDAALAVFIMIDVSGSMDDQVITRGAKARIVDTKANIALDAGFTLAKGVELAGHLAKVVEFSDMDYVAKDWLDSIYYPTKRPGDGGTQGAPSLRRAQVDFPYIQKEADIHNHVLIILTDGQWSDGGTSALILSDLVKKGVFVIAIGIETDPSPIHGAWKVVRINDATDIASAMVDPLRKLAVDIAKNIRRRVA